jgi:hypothetical protein
VDALLEARCAPSEGKWVSVPCGDPDWIERGCRCLCVSCVMNLTSASPNHQNRMTEQWSLQAGNASHLMLSPLTHTSFELSRAL